MSFTAPIYFNPEEFRALIRMDGEPVTHFPSTPCNHSSARTWQVDTAQCDCDRGFRYHEATLAPDVRVFIGRLQKSVVVAPLGLVKQGTTTIVTMPDEILPSFGDKFRLDRRESLHKDLYVRGYEDRDVLRHAWPLAILEVQQFLNGTLTTYVPDQDYAFDAATGSIVWLDNAPTPGSLYSIKHLYRPEYWYLGELQQEAPPSQYPLAGADGRYVMLPLLGALSEKHPKDIQAEAEAA